MLSFFKRYGDLENFNVQENHGLKSAVVTFKRAEDAYKALSVVEHRISNHHLNVRKVPLAINDKLRELIHATKALKPTLLDLSDTCLTEIGQYCLLAELLSMADTCTRLKMITTAIFEAKYKILGVTEFPELCNQIDFHRILRNFGNGITELNIDDEDFAEESHITLGLIYEHCYHGSLESLKLSNFDMNIQYDVRSQEVLRSLKKLELCVCEPLTTDSGLATNCLLIVHNWLS